MSQMRDLLDLINEMSEDEGTVELHDSFSIEIGDDLLIESGVIDINEDGILIEGDEKSLQLLEEHGLILEETDWKKYDEPTINRIKSGKTKPVDKTDYDKPAYQRKKEKEEKKEVEEALDLKTLRAAAASVSPKGSSDKKFDPKAKVDHKKEIPSKDGKLDLNALRDMVKEEDIDEAEYRGRKVPLGKKMPGDVKKSKVYVKKPNGNVVKVEFGDKNMRIKKSNPKRRKSFRARHNCDNPGPRWKARYWSCRAW